ncbi:ATP-dependent DNA helicase MER3 [Coniosporium tulheliwenetii]|uniref:ATP-dependent DNA helicase MER3 n=1 Tax=Coniosporium tulheliwenetii TaxID=3383036 RepID=A0ACC2YIL3_9PEZI|nr:ATP-dependent DNA helicase MER3 [Cladosporium sp. JES 115]
MDGSVFDLLDDIDERAQAGAAGLRSRQPLYQRNTVPVDGYHHSATHDRAMEPDYYPRDPYAYAEDDTAAGKELPLDAFDEEVLRRPYDDRQRQAAQGRARLTLAPRHPERNMHAREPSYPGQEYGSMGVKSKSYDALLMAGTDALQVSPTTLRVKYQNSRQHEDEVYDDRPRASAAQEFQPSYYKAAPKQMTLRHAPPMAQGVELVPTHELPDRFRSIFPFPLFNAIQSKSFQAVYRSNDNFVLSSPTGSGKTAILELAICRIINGYSGGQYKIVYQAPTKSLCSERQRDWHKKFGPLDLQCAELTGDTDGAQLHKVQNASIIITTPEKWDSMTRKWKDHEKLMRMVKLFLVDEVHILKEDRGATLEAVVSRMKSVGSDVRFVALSATVPNLEDVAAWLGRNPTNQGTPALHEKFGEEFRPVKLQKHVVGFQSNGNDFVFDKVLDSKLPDMIAKYSQRKPIMIFCCTRNATVITAKLLANWWSTKGPKDRYWEAPRRHVKVLDNDLRSIEQADRLAVEQGFLGGDINVICCTSTLAVGVNLPCHFVIIKNTVSWQGNVRKEYADLEVMQMLGRAGRPQFDDSAVAVIMTRTEKARHYEKMVSGEEILESCLHLNLIEHLNAEIGLGTVKDLHSAKKWLAGTFLYVRLRENPNHYRLEGDSGSGNLDERLGRICDRSVSLLREHDLVEDDTATLRSTEFGDAMARYYLQFHTMKVFLSLQPKAKLSEILSALAQAAEFGEFRFRSGEKSLYKELNKSPFIKFSIPVDLAMPAHKVSLVIQSVLGGIDLPVDDKTAKHKIQYNTDVFIIFQHVHRLIRCIIDCQLYLEDSVASRNALMLARSLGARVWDDSPLQLKQIEQIGVVAVRKLVNAGVKTIEELENMEPHRIETVLSKHPPFGMKLLDRLKAFPKLRVSVQMMGKSIKPGEGAKVNLKAEIGFMNEKVPETYQKKAVYVCLLAETSDGHKVHFCRISAKKLNKGQDVLFSANMTSPSQSITCYVMCDEIAGTLRQASLKPEIPASAFPTPKAAKETDLSARRSNDLHKPGPNTSKRRQDSIRPSHAQDDDDFEDLDLDDSDFVKAATADLDFTHTDTLGSQTSAATRKNIASNAVSKKHSQHEPVHDEEEWEPRRLDNGKWACNHKCNDKNSCSHLCCREGMDKPPKRPKNKNPASEKPSTQQAGGRTQKKLPGTQGTQTKLNLNATKKSRPQPTQDRASIECVDLSKRETSDDYMAHAPRDYKVLHRLHTSVQKAPPLPPSATRVMRSKPGYSYAEGGTPSLSFLGDTRDTEHRRSSEEYGGWPSPSPMAEDHMADTMSPPHEPEEMDVDQRSDSPRISDDDSMLDAAMVGLADSEDLKPTQSTGDYAPLQAYNDDYEFDSWVGSPKRPSTPETTARSPGKPAAPAPKKEKSLFVTDASSSQAPESTPEKPTTLFPGFKRAREMIEIPQPITPPPAKKLKKPLHDDEPMEENAAESVDKEEKLAPVACEELATPVEKAETGV